MAAISEAIWTPEAVVTWTLDKVKASLLFLILLSSIAFVSAEQSFVFPDDGGSDTGFYEDDWFQAPSYDSQSELLFEILAPFAFMTILLQFSLKKALQMTFAEDDNRWRHDKPNVHKEATLMAFMISGMLLASPYWSLIRRAAASIGVLTVGMLGLILLYVIYKFIQG